MTKVTLFKSFRAAFNGIIYVLRRERNLKIQLVTAILAVLLAFLLKIPKLDFIIIIMICFLVVMLEMINSCFEKLIDRMCKKTDKDYGLVKDMLAGIVLLSAVLATIVGVIIFYSPVKELVIGFIW